MEFGEAEGVLGEGGAERLDGLTDRAADGAEIAAPVVVAPDLEPVDDEAVAAERAGEAGGEQGEVGERAGVDDVVAAAVAQEMREDAEPEAQGGPIRRRPPPV